ncbi:hypothetical protein [Mycetocola sp. JXN-3]|uniref:hypothetical protein n=1 Tax=Mycetocola sp. JXN-3 TaxID=2116510 RepID=UPI00165D0639|nr:hypothetical protein [Mycetocola sp. JXN-3]
MTAKKARELAEVTIRRRVVALSRFDALDVALEAVPYASSEEVDAVEALVASAQVKIAWPEVGE